MTQRPAAASPRLRRAQHDDIQDEVYRQMFRIEEHRPGAENDLAVALVRATVASEATPARSSLRHWLRKICPVCLAMIESARKREEKAGCSTSNGSAC
jgi:hypothetical protein